MATKTDRAGNPLCPKCKVVVLNRVGRAGLWEDLVLYRLGYRPWLCPECKARFCLRHKGTKARSKNEEFLSGDEARAAFLAGYRTPPASQQDAAKS
jgi:hypothetical protein